MKAAIFDLDHCLCPAAAGSGLFAPVFGLGWESETCEEAGGLTSF